MDAIKTIPSDPEYTMRRTTKLILAFTLILSTVLPNSATAEENTPAKIDVLILTGFDVGVHQWRETSLYTAGLLEESGRFDVKVCEDVGILESSSLDSYDVVVLNYGFWEAPQPSEQAKSALLNYVKSGHGLVALHFASSAFQEWDEYGQLLGRAWKKDIAGHGPRGKFTVNIQDADHPITKGLADFEADDELYAKLSGDAPIEVLASANSDWSDAVEPIVFIRRYAQGTVVHNVLGHDIRARENPSFQTLLRRGVEYAATGEVTLD